MLASIILLSTLFASTVPAGFALWKAGCRWMDWETDRYMKSQNHRYLK